MYAKEKLDLKVDLKVAQARGVPTGSSALR